MLVTTEEYISRGFDELEGQTNPEFVFAKAENIVNLLTDGLCEQSDNLSDYKIDTLKQAICAQAEQFFRIANSSAKGGTEKVTIGDYSLSSTVETVDGDYDVISPFTLAILKLAGLFYRGVAAA